MKIRYLILALVMFAAAFAPQAVSAQETTTPIRWVSTTAGRACVPTARNNALVYRYSGTPGIYRCTATNTWTMVGGTAGGALLSAQGTLTVSTPWLSQTATWNAGGVTFVNDFSNITDTASAAGSLLIERQVGGVSKFSVTKGGAGTFAGAITSGGNAVVTADQLLKSYLATTVTYNNVDVLANTALSVTVASSGIYNIDVTVHAANAVSGLNMDFGGTATVTNFIGEWSLFKADDPSTGHITRVTAAGTDFHPSEGDAVDGFYTFKGTIEVNVGGTFLLRGAQDTADVSNTTILRGSTLVLRKMN